MTATGVPPGIVALSDYALHAQNILAAEVYAHIAGGSADEQALRSNSDAFSPHAIWPRPLTSCREGSTSLTLFGEAFAHPVLLAPVSYQRLVHPDGEIATAQAADALETGMVVSTLSSVALELVAEELSRNRWFQMYFQAERAGTQALLERAERAGYSAIVVTVDAPVSGIRNRAERAGFRMPADVTAANLPAVSNPLPAVAPGHSRVFQSVMAQAPVWADLEWLREQTRLPILLKGALHPDDVMRAIDTGVDGVVLSNHGGRALDRAPAALSVLPLVRQAVGEDFPLLIDGGIRRGSDVFISLALGANAVLIGRPQIYALAVAGAHGVAHMLRIIRDELEVTMALTGCATLDAITAESLVSTRGEIR